mgnify:CR=1 FL=1
MYHFDKKIQYQNDEEYQSQFLSLFGLEKYSWCKDSNPSLIL